LIEGQVTDNGIPVIGVEVGGRRWRAIIGTGFNGDVELPDSLRTHLEGECVGRVASLLAAGQRIEEDVYLVAFPFDGQMLTVQATFVGSEEILIGTHMLRHHRLHIDFPAQTLTIEK
jgi:predicted aspartyl protease